VTTVTRRVVSDLDVMVAGQGGDGSLTVVNLLARLLSSRGFHLYSARDVASRIKGGHAAALLRGCTRSQGCIGDRIDLLVAFDEEAVARGAPLLNERGAVVFDSSLGPPPEGLLPDGARVLGVPFGRLAVRDLRRDLFKNSLAFGVLTRLLGVDDGEAVATLRAGLSRLAPAVVEANVGALETGFGHATEQGLAPGEGPWELDRAETGERIFISGNEALALGFLAAGGRFFTGYPITPASEILDWLERRLPEYGGVAVQAEDELAAINMAIGAAMTGTRAMTATSGPGISLMQEGVSHLGGAEVPLVVVDCQRAGPTTGMPTKPEQSDLQMVVHGGNGDFPRVVLAPGNPTECFELAALATSVAQRLQGPVYLVLDQAVAQDAATVAPFDFAAITLEDGPRLTPDEVAGLAEYRRYLVTDDGVSPWALPGTPGGMSLVTGNEHDEWGKVSTDPANRVRMMQKRLGKIETIRPSLPPAVRFGEPDAPIGLVGIGLEAAVMQAAAGRLAEAGVPVAGFRPRTIHPILDETLEFLDSRERTYVVEHNAEGQLARLLAEAGAPTDRLGGVLRYDGVPFRPGELAERILGLERAS
jgi:2-oxoglutarate ferredoxin oxidoreductase subunit alpha